MCTELIHNERRKDFYIFQIKLIHTHSIQQHENKKL
jgi:hypothetical protein